MLYCANCKTKLIGNPTYCPGCGRMVIYGDQPLRQQPGPITKTAGKAIFGLSIFSMFFVGGIILIGLFVFLILIMTG